MKRRLSTVVIANAMTAVFAFAGAQLNGYEVISRASAQQTPHSGPAQMLPELDNESVVVLRIRMAPHEKTGLHDVSARLVIWLTDAHIRDTKADGTTTDYRRAAGSTEWVSAQQHAGENLSDNSIEFLAIGPKSNRPGASPIEHRERH